MPSAICLHLFTTLFFEFASQDANRLADLLLPLHEVTRDARKPLRKRTGLLVNLIPFNEGGDVLASRGSSTQASPQEFRRPTDETVKQFQEQLRSFGVWASVRVQRGDDQSAACGMLATAAASATPAPAL